MPKLQVIVGGQFGSEAKGHIAGFLAAEAKRPVCIRVAGPNAGHSVVNPATGTKHALRQIPVGAVTNPRAILAIAAGSEVDLQVLVDEIHRLEADGVKVRDRLYIDPAATLLEQRHIDREGVRGITARIGSTGKGIGAARADRIMREALTVGDKAAAITLIGTQQVSDYANVWSPNALIRDDETDLVQVEGTQGYGLGLHTDFYPQVTSSDCTALDFLAMARINPWEYQPQDLSIWVVYRPHPIRVAGNSGPLLRETTWAKLGLPEEETTVTRKIRRVGHWDGALAQMAFRANGGLNGPVLVALTMADQIDPALAGSTNRADLHESLRYGAFVDQMRRDLGGVEPGLVTTSDRTCIDLRRLTPQ